MTRILLTYSQRCLNTVRQFISTYAPATENHTENYINFVADLLGVDDDEAIDVNTRMFDLVKAISIFENGLIYAACCSDNRIRTGIALA